MNGKREGNEYLKNGGGKVRVASFEDDFLIVMPYWPTLCRFGTGIGVYEDNHVGKNKRFELALGIANEDERVNNLSRSIYTSKIDRGGEDIGIGIVDIDTNRGVNNPGTRTANIKAVDNLGIDIDVRANKQAVVSNKVHASLFFSHKIFFILIFFSKFETVFTSSFIFCCF